MKNSILLGLTLVLFCSTSGLVHARANPFAKVKTTPLVLENIINNDLSAPDEFPGELKQAVKEALRTKKLLSDNTVNYDQPLDRLIITVIEYHPTYRTSSVARSLTLGMVTPASLRDPASTARIEIISAATNKVIYENVASSKKQAHGNVAKDLAENIAKKLAFKLKIHPVTYTAKTSAEKKAQQAAESAIESSKAAKHVPTPENSTPDSDKSLRAKLLKLKELHAEGLITDDEYQASKKKALEAGL